MGTGLRPTAARSTPAEQKSCERGIAVSRPMLLGSTAHDFTHRRMRVMVYACQRRTGRLRSRGGQTVQWRGRFELNDLPLATFDRKILAVALGGFDADSKSAGV